MVRSGVPAGRSASAEAACPSSPARRFVFVVATALLLEAGTRAGAAPQLDRPRHLDRRSPPQSDRFGLRRTSATSWPDRSPFDLRRVRGQVQARSAFHPKKQAPIARSFTSSISGHQAHPAGVPALAAEYARKCAVDHARHPHAHAFVATSPLPWNGDVGRPTATDAAPRPEKSQQLRQEASSQPWRAARGASRRCGPSPSEDCSVAGRAEPARRTSSRTPATRRAKTSPKWVS
jgi:hypothetical protein